MSLLWVRLDTTIPQNPKMLWLLEDKKHRAALAYIFSITYSGSHGLDGYVPRAALPFIHATKADAKALTDVGLWVENATGWEINGWTEFQQTNVETIARREKAQHAAAVRWSKPRGEAS
jgi:hypothetical protein